MPVRTFTAASSEKITLALGALGFAFGPGTIAAVINPAQVSAAGSILTVGSVTTASHALRETSAGKIFLGCNNTFPAAPAGLPAMSIGNWYYVAGGKATGTVAPRYHIFDFQTGTWTHADSGTTVANASAPGTRAALGTDVAGTGTFFGGALACCAVWNVVLTDAQHELLPYARTLSRWSVPAVPLAFWGLDQQTTATAVPDQTVGGANQSAITGTTVTADTIPDINHAAVLNSLFGPG